MSPLWRLDILQPAMLMNFFKYFRSFWWVNLSEQARVNSVEQQRRRWSISIDGSGSRAARTPPAYQQAERIAGAHRPAQGVAPLHAALLLAARAVPPSSSSIYAARPGRLMPSFCIRWRLLLETGYKHVAPMALDQCSVNI